MRGCNQHGIRLGSAQKIIDGIKWFSGRKRLHAVSFRITDGGQLAARDFPRRDVLRVEASHCADSDDSESYRFHAQSSPNARIHDK
jgi:hypothetical protein